jgi:large conductance mechanosensitive channel
MGDGVVECRAPGVARPNGGSSQMSTWVKEFKDFINRGNVVDLAVAVVLGAAFGAVINSFVENILMRIISIIVGEPTFDDLDVTINDAVISYGSFITDVITFVSIAFGVFLVVKAYNRFKKPPVEEVAAVTEVELLTEIRDALVRR